MADKGTVTDVGAVLKRVKAEVNKAVVGYGEQVEDFMTCLLTDGHILMEGVPGIAKTTLSKAFTSVCGLSYHRIQFTQDLLPADITGHYFYNQKTGEFQVRKGPLFADMVLADEINRAPPKTQSALLEAMQERQITIEGNTFDLPNPFIVVATLNPIETEGVYPLPEAQIDRFMIKSTMDYLSPEEEIGVLKLGGERISGLQKVLSREQVEQMAEAALNIHAHSSVLSYVRDLMRETREVEQLELGLSPRGGIHLLLAAKAKAYLSGRSYVIPDDVKAMAHKVVDHRLILATEAELEGLTRASITDTILSKIPVPKSDFKSREN
jgi:MoxR-like ATPase